jgi:hypothetical protein
MTIGFLFLALATTVASQKAVVSPTPPPSCALQLTSPSEGGNIVYGTAGDGVKAVYFVLSEADGVRVETTLAYPVRAEDHKVAGVFWDHKFSAGQNVMTLCDGGLPAAATIMPADSPASVAAVTGNASRALAPHQAVDKKAKSEQATTVTPPEGPAETPAVDPCSGEDQPALSISGDTAGSDTLSGVSPMDGDVRVCVNGKPRRIAAKAAPKVLQDTLPLANSRYEVTLESPLASGNNLAVVVTGKDGMQRIRNQTESVVAAIPAPGKVTVLTKVAPGVKTLQVQATPTRDKGGYEVRVRPCPGAQAPVLAPSTANRLWEVTDANGTATLNFDQPLYASQPVSVCEEVVNTTDSSAEAKSSESEQLVASDPLDLGHVRYYFTTGVVLSSANNFQGQSNGSQAGMFLGFNADRAWLNSGGEKNQLWNLNTYFDARLTSVATGATTQSNGVTEQFIQSRKAALLQGGIYLPYNTTWWKQGQYSLFAAPLVKAGFATLLDDAPQTSTVVASPNRDGHFFTFWSYGTRLGFYRHSRGANSMSAASLVSGKEEKPRVSQEDDGAPELVSFVDLTRGRFGAFEAFRPDTQDPTGFIRVRPMRWSVEGLLKIPSSPFVVGFSANVGGAVGPQVKNGVTLPFTQPRDDLRFLFGAQFDAAKLLKVIPTL